MRVISLIENPESSSASLSTSHCGRRLPPKQAVGTFHSDLPPRFSIPGSGVSGKGRCASNLAVSEEASRPSGPTAAQCQGL